MLVIVVQKHSRSITEKVQTNTLIGSQYIGKAASCMSHTRYFMDFFLYHHSIGAGTGQHHWNNGTDWA
jgi:hypothetical protein